MHIAFLTPEYPSPKTGSSGGLGTSILNLAHALVLGGVKVSIFVYGQDEDENYMSSGINFFRIKNQRLKGLSWWLVRKKIEKVINLAIQIYNIDILEVADWTGISAWMKINCLVVMRLHGSDTFFCHLDKRPVKWWNKLQEKTAYRKADAIIAVSDFVGRLSNELFKCNRKYEVIPNSIDLGKFGERNSYIDPDLILYFGTLVRKKGVMEIPLIFNKVIEKKHGAKLLLVGSDSSDILKGSSSTWALMQNRFSSQALQNVEYIGKMPYNEIKEYIQKASVCIFPSYAEALPVSWLEAMALRKAIVASNIGWANEMITDEFDGLLVDPKNHQSFADAIISLADSNLRNKLGENAHNTVVTRFSTTKIASQTIDFYSKISSL